MSSISPSSEPCVSEYKLKQKYRTVISLPMPVTQSMRKPPISWVPGGNHNLWACAHEAKGAHSSNWKWTVHFTGPLLLWGRLPFSLQCFLPRFTLEDGFTYLSEMFSASFAAVNDTGRMGPFFSHLRDLDGIQCAVRSWDTELQLLPVTEEMKHC